MLLISGTGLPIDELAKVATRVIEKNTYNTLAYDHWKAEMDFSGLNMKGAENPPARYCEACNCNHPWWHYCPNERG